MLSQEREHVLYKEDLFTTKKKKKKEKKIVHKVRNIYTKMLTVLRRVSLNYRKTMGVKEAFYSKSLRGCMDGSMK